MRTVPVLLSFLLAFGAAHAAPSSPLAPTEALFLEFLDARDAVAYINSGHVDEWEGAKIDDWTARQLSRHQALLANIKTLKPAELPPADAAALAAINITLGRLRRPEPRSRERAGRAHLRGPPRQVARLRRTLRRALRLLPRDRQQAQFRGRHHRSRRRARPLVRPRGSRAAQGAARRLPPAVGRAQRQQRARQPVPAADQARRGGRIDQRLRRRRRRARDRRVGRRRREVAGADPRGLARRQPAGADRALGLPLLGGRGRTAASRRPSRAATSSASTTASTATSASTSPRSASSTTSRIARTSRRSRTAIS